MIIEIALIHILSNGEPKESKVFKGEEASINILLKHCQPYEDENNICLMKQTKTNRIIYTNLDTMEQVVVEKRKK